MMKGFHQLGQAVRGLPFAAALALAAPAAAPAQAEPGGMLTLTFDDSSLTQFTEGLPIAQALGLVGTLFVLTDNAAKAEDKSDPWGMTWAQIAAFHAAGWEIAAHGAGHPSLPDLPDSEVVRELDSAYAEIVRHLDLRPVSFASPFGNFDDRTLALISPRYRYHVMAWGGSEGRNPLPVTDPYRISRMNVQEGVDPQAICAEMEQAAVQGTWLVLLFHGFVAENPEPYETTTGTFRRMLACAADLRDQGRLRVVTLREAMEIAAPP